MNTVERVTDLRLAINAVKRSGKTVGLVPTMGSLHAGHLSLIEKAKVECDFVVMSLFVNPTQFTDIEDFEKYPRDPVRDRALAEKAGVDIVFEPTVEEMYGKGFDTVVAVRLLSDVLEGKSRPGHFQGVATVVTKLINMAGAHKAFFGEKDYQQLQVIRRMVSDLNIPVQIVQCPIVREPDGLALSSRNVRLSEKQRSAAVILKRALDYAQEIADTGVHDAFALSAWIAQTIEVEPEAKLDYATIVDPDDLREVDTIDEGGVALVAATFGKVRLIDNKAIKPSPGYPVRR
jgi:pantoate--beta-alanine ligase